MSNVELIGYKGEALSVASIFFSFVNETSSIERIERQLINALADKIQLHFHYHSLTVANTNELPMRLFELSQ